MIEIKESLVHFFSMSLILVLLFGPTAFILGIGILSIGILIEFFFLIPTWLF